MRLSLAPLPLTFLISFAAAVMGRVGSFVLFLDGNSALNVYRHLSDKPRHLEWARHVASRDLQSALRSDGPLAEEDDIIESCIRSPNAQTFVDCRSLNGRKAGLLFAGKNYECLRSFVLSATCGVRSDSWCRLHKITLSYVVLEQGKLLLK